MTRWKRQVDFGIGHHSPHLRADVEGVLATAGECRVVAVEPKVVEAGGEARASANLFSSYLSCFPHFATRQFVGDLSPDGIGAR